MRFYFCLEPAVRLLKANEQRKKDYWSDLVHSRAKLSYNSRLSSTSSSETGSGATLSSSSSSFYSNPFTPSHPLHLVHLLHPRQCTLDLLHSDLPHWE